jgi:hypothetical protein
MPFYLPEFYGGLGNQLFSIVTLYALAKKYNTTFCINTTNLIAPGFVVNRVYSNVFTCLLESSYYSNINNTFPVINYNVEQFRDYTFDANYVSTHTICICGLPMKYSLFESCVDEISKLFHSYKTNVYPTIVNCSTSRLCIAIRRFTNEKSEHWATSLEYYKNAIKHMSTIYNKCIIHVYTDTINSSTLLLPFIQEYFGNSCIAVEEFCGNKESQTDIQHLFAMFDYNNYILCNSTYHYWAALLTTCKSAHVLYPSDCEWYPHIAHTNWIRL